MLSQLPPWDPRESTTHRAASGQILPFRHSHPFVPLGGVVVTLRVTTSMRGRPQTAPEDAGSRAVQTSHPEPWSHHHNRRKCRPKILSSPLTVSFYTPFGTDLFLLQPGSGISRGHGFVTKTPLLSHHLRNPPGGAPHSPRGPRISALKG